MIVQIPNDCRLYRVVNDFQYSFRNIMIPAGTVIEFHNNSGSQTMWKVYKKYNKGSIVEDLGTIYGEMNGIEIEEYEHPNT